MKISYNWLKKIINFDLNPEQIGIVLTDIGLEVEAIERFESIKGSLNGVIIGEVLETSQHPNADKLKLTKIKISEQEILNIVCGAPNVTQGQKVAVATIGTELFVNNQSFKISKSKIRGEESFGMLCSEVELNIGTDNSGIKIFDDEIQIGTKLKNLYNIQDDFIFEIGLTPNRSDAMSHLGVARDLYAALKFKKNPIEYIKTQYIDFSTEKPVSSFTIQIEDENLCNRYSGILLNNILVKESPSWLKNSLKSIGIEPKNNVVDCTNYVLHHLGQPLHAFDADKIPDKILKIGLCEKNTKFTTLDNKERILSGEELIIKDMNNNPLCIAGVFGGKDSGVSENTTSIFLESAYFNPVVTRKGAKYHQINTDSSFRFERGCDPNITINALNFAVNLLQEYANAEISEQLIDEYPNPIKNKIIVLRYSKIDQILGHKIHREEIKKILTLLDIEILSEHNDNLELSIQPYRFDVIREIDIIEEILRIYGYNNIELPQKIEFSRIKTPKNELLIIENKLANLLVYNGFYECINNSLIPLKQEIKNKVVLLNPLSNDLSMMRTNLINGLLENLAFNFNRKQTSIKLFELGKSYQKINNSFIETPILSILLSGQNNTQNWATQINEFNFFDLRGYVEQILKLLGINNFTEEFISDEYFSEALNLKIKNDILVTLGIINKKITKEKDISKTVLIANFNLNNLNNYKEESKKTQEISKFPDSKRDLSLVIDKNITYRELKDLAYKTENKILKNVELFDVYEGNKIPENKKSYALSFYLQDGNKTLTDKQIDQTINKILKQYQEKFNAELRN